MTDREAFDPKDLQELPDFKPKDDPVFVYLVREALGGRVKVYFAGIPLGAISRFDPTHRPELTRAGGAMVDALCAGWRAGRPRAIWVYLSGRNYVCPDDYLALAACQRVGPDHAPCFVLGYPDTEGVIGIEGPLPVARVKRALGFA